MMMGYPNGYRNCNIDTDECASRPCRHGGQCHESTNSGVAGGVYECSCTWPYAGPECEVDLTNSIPRARTSSTCEDWFTDKDFEDQLTETCCTAEGGCQNGYPDTCNEDCAALWMPFWEKCSYYMILNFPKRAAVHPARSEYSDFAAMCEATQYGTSNRCSRQFYSSAHSAMVRACSGFPHGSCNSHCASTYFAFHSACRPVADERGISGDQMDAFLATCQGFPEPGDMVPAPSPSPYSPPPPNPPPPPRYTPPTYTPYVPPTHSIGNIPFSYSPTPSPPGSGHH